MKILTIANSEERIKGDFFYFNELVLKEMNADELLKYAAGKIWQKNYSEALPYIDRALNKDPKLAKGWALKSICQTELGLLGEAEASSQKAITLDQRLFGAWGQRGKILILLYRYEEAFKC